jgi:2'-5' RNA ligase
MPSLRSFIALPTPDSVRDRIEILQADLRQLNADVKWESPEKLHITLKFLGNVESQLLEKLIPSLEEIAREQSSFDLTYEGVGAFPNLLAPRVIWVGTAQNESLFSLQNSVEQRCADFGFARENRAFHPHITLGRVKGSLNIQRLTEKLKTITLEPTRTRCTEFLVMRSDLTPSGSVYSVLKSIPLKP